MEGRYSSLITFSYKFITAPFFGVGPGCLSEQLLVEGRGRYKSQEKVAVFFNAAIEATIWMLKELCYSNMYNCYILFLMAKLLKDLLTVYQSCLSHKGHSKKWAPMGYAGNRYMCL